MDKSVSDNKAIELVETLATVVEEAIKITETANVNEPSLSKESSEIRNEVALIETKAEEAVKSIEDKVADSEKALEKIIVQIKDDNDKLSTEQKEIIEIVYEQVKQSVNTILNAPNVDNAIKVTQTIAAVIKNLEKFSLNDKQISGASKKQIAIELVKDLITGLITDENVKANLLALYDIIGETTLETLIDVSRNLNVKVVTETMEAATNCCVGFLSLFSKK